MQLRHGLKTKILTLTIGLSLFGLGVLVYLVIKKEEADLLKERLRASELMAEPILHTIYKDMLDERADMTRYLIAGLKTIKGVERVQVIRSNGIEEAFQDYKTLEAVKAEFGELKPEWTAGHPNKLANVAEGVGNPEFKRAIAEFKSGRKDAVSYIENEGGRNLHFTYLVPIVARPKCSSCHAREEAARGVLMISTSLDEMYALLAGSRDKWIIHGGVTIAAIAVLLWFLMRAFVSRPVDNAVGMLKSIAEGRGDLTKGLTVSSADEIGTLGLWFNKFVEGLRQLVGDVERTSRQVLSSSSEIEKASREITAGVAKQLTASADAASSIREMDTSIKTVADETAALKASSIGVAGSARTLSESVEAVKHNMESLTTAGVSVNASINDMASSVGDVAVHLDSLSRKTEDVVASLLEIGASVREIEAYARSQAEVAEKVRSDAEELGLTSVMRTREGIENVSREVASTSTVVNRLADRSREIGKILTVINEIADTTHLLALNATILASQAGEHGRGFEVVARQVKNLATETTASTKEIASLIAEVQSEAASAAESMRRSFEKVEDGVRLSQGAEEALKKILDSARRSFEVSKMIEKATIGQTRGVGLISNVTQVINGMVGEIKAAADEQSAAAGGILKDTAQMKEFMEKVRQSTTEQTEETKLVSAEIAGVVEKIERVALVTADQAALSRRIVAAMETVRVAAEDNADLASRLDRTVKEMNRQADALRDTVSSFRT